MTLLAPRRQNLFDLIGDLPACDSAVHSIRQQFVVLGVVMANRGDDCRSQSVLLKVSARLCPADSSASPGSSVFGNRSQFMSRTTGKQVSDLPRHPNSQITILLAPPDGAARSCGRTFPGIFQTLPLSLLQRRTFY